MKLIAHDITQRRERDGQMTTWLSERLLIEELGITEKRLRTKYRYSYAQSVSPAKRNKDILPDTGKSWRYAKIDGQFYYDYDRLPDNRKELLPGKTLLVEEYERSLTNNRRDAIRTSIKAVAKTEYGRFLHHYRAAKNNYDKLAKACAIIQHIAKEVAQVEGTGKCQILKDYCEVLNDVGVAYVPRHWRRLGRKVDAVLRGKPVEQVVKLPRKGNRNASKYLDDAELMSWLLQLRAKQANYTNAFVIRKIRMMCTLAEKPVPSKSWVETQLAKPLTQFLTYQRFGSGKLGDRYKGYIPIENALHAGDCWMADGTRANMIAFKDEEGKERFLYWIAIMDVHSGDILGVHFDTKEDRYAYVNALKMAVSHAGYLPYELVIDRFPGHNTEEIEIMIQRLQLLGVQVTITPKKTGKAKVERLFETIQSVFMAESEWYYGEGVQSSRNSAHRSPEYIAKMKRQRNDKNWTFDEAYREMMRVVQLYRTTKLSEYSSKYKNVELSPAEMHNKSAKPHTRKAEIWDTVQLFGLEKTVTIRNGGLIRTEIQKVEYFYRVEEYTTLSEHKKVRLCYDMEDLGEVYLFADSDDANREYLGIATEQRRAQIYGPDADFKELGKQEAMNKRIEQARKEHYKTLVTTSDEDGFENPADEVNILLGGLADKVSKGDAETAWLEERTSTWKDTKGKPRIIQQTNDEEDFVDDLVPDARSQY